MREVTKHVGYNNIGQVVTITIQMTYDDRECIDLPSGCYSCPCGYMIRPGEEFRSCGAPSLLTDGPRPDTCKLKQVDYDELLAQIRKLLNS